jgi:hypothetical protein
LISNIKNYINYRNHDYVFWFTLSTIFVLFSSSLALLGIVFSFRILAIFVPLSLILLSKCFLAFNKTKDPKILIKGKITSYSLALLSIELLFYILIDFLTPMLPLYASVDQFYSYQRNYSLNFIFIIILFLLILPTFFIFSYRFSNWFDAINPSYYHKRVYSYYLSWIIIIPYVFFISLGFIILVSFIFENAFNNQIISLYRFNSNFFQALRSVFVNISLIIYLALFGSSVEAGIHLKSFKFKQIEESKQE